MRKLSIVAAIVAAAFVVPAAASAQERAQVGAFGGLTFGNTTSATTFGGSISAPFASNIQIIAEGGRLDNVMPSLVGTLLDFTPVDVRLSAWYGEAACGSWLHGTLRSRRTPRRLRDSHDCGPDLPVGDGSIRS